MPDARVPGHCFREKKAPFLRFPGAHGPFDSTVLIAKGYFKMINIFPVTLEPEMSRFNHARVNGTHGAGVVLPVSVIMFDCGSFAGSTGAVQYLNELVNVGILLAG